MNDDRGSIWHRWDLHFHTPSSFDYKNNAVTNQQIVDRLIEEKIRVVAITDHHIIDVDRIKDLKRLSDGRITILPGIELRSELGSKPIHYICIFPEDINLDNLSIKFQGSLGLTKEDISSKGGDEKIYIPLQEGFKLSRELGGVVSIHAGNKSNSIEGISNREQFQQRLKYDTLKNYIDLMEIGQLKDVDVHLKTIFPATGLEKPLIICSDNHNIADYLFKAPLWLRADPTFRGLLMVLREPRDRVFIGDQPKEVVRVEHNPTKYVKSLSFSRKAGAPDSEKWFNGSISFNSGLVAIIGNKGSGKSALADTLGLLGATKNSASFSFLSKDRFRHPSGGYAEYFDAEIEWHSDEKVSRCLAESLVPQAVERLKYLPQDYLEKVCNEPVGIGEEGFERELKSVIFSHVPENQRLGKTTLDDLVWFQTEEKQNRIDALLKLMKEISRLRAALEAEAAPNVKLEIEEKIKQYNAELEAHKKVKPQEMPEPLKTGDASSPDAVALRVAIAEEEDKKKHINDQINEANSKIRIAKLRQALSNKLLEKFENFQKDFDVFKTSLSEDAKELGLQVDSLVELDIRKKDVIEINDKATADISIESEKIGRENPPGLQQQLLIVNEVLAELQGQLDAPNRAYQAYLKELKDWEERLVKLKGSKDDPESLNGLKSALEAQDNLPAKIEELKNRQIDISLQIHAQKLAQADVYRSLYGPVQNFIDSHALASDKLKLEFRVELIDEGFSSRLLSLLALNRRGSFMGVDDGRAKAEKLIQRATLDNKESIQRFLNDVDMALHEDLRNDSSGPTLLKDQVLREKKPEEVFNCLYGLEYIRPRYILRWEGKDLSMLSPGERGTLLLVFYLLIDKSDIPLVIDQPEGNLDNHTVAKVLVECIKEARTKRQVFIVTHNPNLAVVCDADQVINASMDKVNGNMITYTSGALENHRMSQFVTDVLEGTRWAFGVRKEKYDIGSTDN